jgi:4-amino-4-deoxychorismate lyase
MSEWYTQGEKLQTLPIDDRGSQYGDGVFETIAIRDGQPRFWKMHVERLVLGCDRLGIPAPSTALLSSDIADAIRQSYLDDTFATAKIVVTAGRGPRGYRRPEPIQSAVYVWVGHASRTPKESYQQGVEVTLCATRLAIQPALAGIKSLNRLEQVLARSEWQDDSIFEGLMLDTEERLICGTMSNVFIASAKSVATPSLTRCGVAGVMRRHVLATMAQNNIDCEVRDIRHDELQQADEVFLTNSQFGILPVARCGSEGWAVGDLTLEVMNSAGLVEIAEHGA